MQRIMMILATTALMTSTGVSAKCAEGGKTLFFCLTAKGKQIEVCDAGKTIDYTFGKAQEKPEIALKVPRSQAATQQWAGIGRYISYSVDLPNGNTTYSVFWSLDRLSEKQAAIEAGVNVIIQGQLAATVACSGTNIINRLEGVDLKPAR